MKTEDLYQDVLQNIEFIISSAYKKDSSFTDLSVMSILEALIDFYTAEIRGRATRSFKLSPQEQALFDGIKGVCEWRLGRGSLDKALIVLRMKDSDAKGTWIGRSDIDPKKAAPDASPELKTVEEIIQCLRRVLKSVKFWYNEGGRRGYLDFIVQHVL